MASSLRELLTQEGFQSRYRKPVKPKDKVEAKPLPLYICHDRKSLDFSNDKVQKSVTRSGSSSSQSKRGGSASGTSNSNSDSRVTVGPPMGEVAIRAVITILSGYIGNYKNDDCFRKTIREKCNSCLMSGRKNDSDNEILVNMEMGMESIDRLVQDQRMKKKQMRIKSLRNSIELLTIVASLNSKSSKDGSTCGIPNSHLSACAQLYLAIVYKLEKNDRLSARHLLQVFCDSPFLARTFLLPELWEHLFLPHLLHLKIWYTKELEFLSNESHDHEKQKKLKALSRVYNEKVDRGTTLFALYYKQWLKVGANEPPIPIVPLPSRPRHNRSLRRKSSDSFNSHSSMNQNLYQAVFGPKLERKSTSFDDQNGVLRINWGSETDQNLNGDEYNSTSVQKEDRRTSFGRSSRKIDKNHPELWLEPQRSDYFQCFSCRSIPTESLIIGNNVVNNVSMRKETALLSSDFIRAITTLCSSGVLSECEFAVRMITKAWLYSHGDPLIVEALTKPSVIEAMLEVLFASNEEEILELVVSILAELVRRNDAIGQIILNSDPQLEIFVRLLRSTSLFLKAAVLLYLSKPLAKQMLSTEWVPLVLRVLEFGDKLQTLFTVQCSPQEAAFYYLDQLLTGFDEDKNLENARQVVSLGGLTLLIRRIEAGEIHERNEAASIISCCVHAEGSCRNYLADNLDMACLLELIVLDCNKNSSGSAFSVLAELLSLDRRTKISKFLRGLKEGWGGLNTMHILFMYLRRAQPEERPLVATVLLLLDLMEDPFKGSFYRKEAVEALVYALNCQMCDDGIQEQSARALLLLAGRFSYTGESIMEEWLLQKAGFQESCFQDSCHGKEIVFYDSVPQNEEQEVEIWQERVACALLKSGNKKLLSALADSIANGIPSLARASLVTVSWMSRYLHHLEDTKIPSLASSTLMPQLLQCLNYDRDNEERVLASYALLCLLKSSGPSAFDILTRGCVSVTRLYKESFRHLQNLSLVTWTATELLSIISTSTYQS